MKQKVVEYKMKGEKLFYVEHFGVCITGDSCDSRGKGKLSINSLLPRSSTRYCRIVFYM